MRLTSFTDYALRLLIYAAAHPDRRVTVEEVASYFDLSRGHLKKVVLTLVHGEFLVSMKGRNGGLALARPPAEINLGAVVRATEPDFAVFECFQTGNLCRISRPCALPGIANRALGAFVEVFDRHTLADVMVRPDYFLSPAPAAKQPVRGPAIPSRSPIGRATSAARAPAKGPE